MISSPQRPRILIGCAGWSLSSAVQPSFPPEGTHLERYARILPAVEINTSFYRPHKPETYARWRDSVPEHFRFSVKVPRAITHEAKLREVEPLLARFVHEVSHLEDKLGCLLVQLPPSLRLEETAARAFFESLRQAIAVPLVCEPRHITWFGQVATRMLADYGIARVVADPEAIPNAPPAADADIAYIRLHGSPVMYHSPYPASFLDQVARQLQAHQHAGRQAWCIFDNTASGAAVPDALSLMSRLSEDMMHHDQLTLFPAAQVRPFSSGRST